MQKKELTEQIGQLNLKIVSTSKEIEELRVNAKRKKIEIMKYKHKIKEIQLKLKELELEEWKKVQEQKRIRKTPMNISKKYDDPNNDFYSQEKKYISNENSYIDYMKKNILPYND